MERSHISAPSAQKGGARNGRSISIFLDSAYMLFLNSITHSPKTLTLTILKILICFCLLYTPFFANASAAEKWEILENNYDHTKNTVNVTAKKVGQSAANNSVYKVQVPVNASTLGSTVKMMLKGGVASAALYGLVEGVGWIIDEGSKTIKKPVETEIPNYPYIYRVGSKVYPAGSYSDTARLYFSELKSNSSYWADKNYAGWDPIRCFYGTDSDNWCDGNLQFTSPVDVGVVSTRMQINRIYNPDYIPDLEPQFEPVSDSELGNEILGKGTEPLSSKTPSPSLITDAYSPNNPISDAAAPQQTNKALDSSNPQPNKEPEGKSETEAEKDEDGKETGKTSSKFELPNFCEWAPAVCDFFAVQKQDNKDIKENQKLDTEQSKTFFEKVEDWFNWTREPPNNETENNEIDIENIPVPTTSVNISIGDNICPSLPFSMYGRELNLSPIYLCQQAEMIRTFFIALGFWTASMIVGRRK